MYFRLENASFGAGLHRIDIDGCGGIAKWGGDYCKLGRGEVEDDRQAAGQQDRD